jgi:hypothetical protein
VNKLATLVLIVGLSACSRKKPEEGREPAQSAAPGAVVGSAAAPPPPVAPAPGSAAPAEAPAAGSAAAAVDPAQGGTPCAAPTTMTCDAKLSDGCVGDRTTVHACVEKDAKVGGPCGDGAALTCAAGQADACASTPPLAKNHVCVIVARPTP